MRGLGIGWGLRSNRSPVIRFRNEAPNPLARKSGFFRGVADLTLALAGLVFIIFLVVSVVTVSILGIFIVPLREVPPMLIKLGCRTLFGEDE